MATGNFISYLRVSTDRQGKSGLGLEAQREAVEAYLNGGRWKLVNEFVEVESGKDNARPQLAAALAACRVHKAALVVAKVDRLARSVGFLSSLLEAGVDVRFADLPAIEGPTGRFMLQQMAAVAELEAGLISTRTKAALAAAKRRGVKLGGFRGTAPTRQHRAAGNAAMKAAADRRAADLAPVVQALQEDGIVSLSGLARALAERNIPTARGGTDWSPVQVSRLLERMT